MIRYKRAKRLFAFLLAALLLAVASGLPHALANSNLTSDEKATIESYKKQQAELKEKIAENKQKLDELKGDIAQQREYVSTLQAQIAAYQSQIDSLNENIAFLQGQQAEIQKKIDALDEEIAGIEAQINHNELQQIDLQQEIEDIYAVLEERLCEIYMYGRTSVLELLLNSTDLKSFLITLELSQNMAKHDDGLIVGLNAKIKEIDGLIEEQQKLIDEINLKKAEHEQEIAALEAKAEEIRGTRSAVEAAQESVKELESEAMSYLNQLDQKSAEYQSMVNGFESQIEAFEKKIDSIIESAASRNMSGGSFTPSSGLIWPLQYSDVYISSSYGGRTDPATGAYKFHGGCDTCCWSGTYGKSVRAAASGTVLVSTYNAGGYGYYVVIDHGNGLTTVYAHNSQLLVSSGQRVSQGDVIAYAGASGYATGAHVHFEVRENNTKVNPLKYCSP